MKNEKRSGTFDELLNEALREVESEPDTDTENSEQGEYPEYFRAAI